MTPTSFPVAARKNRPPLLHTADLIVVANDLRRISGCTVNARHLYALRQVECGGEAFVRHADGWRPSILFEPPQFYNRSGPHPVSRDFPSLSRRGWPRNPVARRRMYNATPRPLRDGEHPQWVKLDFAAGLDAHYGTRPAYRGLLYIAAVESTSWGMGQVMGFNALFCGYPSVTTFVESMHESEAAQLEAVCRFLWKNRLVDDLARGGADPDSWRALAAGYNGAAYAVHGYHRKLARAFTAAPW